jgi:hypothetical protein
VSKKIEKSIKQRKPRKKTRKNQTEKKPIKPIKIFVKIFGSVWFRFQKPETGKTPTEPNRFGLRGYYKYKKKNALSFLTLAVLLLAPEPLAQLTIHNFTSVTKSIHLHLQDHNQPHPSLTIFIFKRQSATSLSHTVTPDLES